MSFNRVIYLFFLYLILLFCSGINVYAVSEGLYAGQTNESMNFWFHVNYENGIDYYHMPYHVYDEYDHYLYTNAGTTSYSTTVFTTILADNTFDYHVDNYWGEKRFTGTFSGSSVTGSYYWNNKDNWDPEKTSDTLTWIGVKSVPGIQITQQPVDITVTAGSTASFSVSATFTSGTSYPGYQWYKDGTWLSNERTATLEITDVQLADDGAIYTCYLYSLQDGLLVSDGATLTVTASSLKGDVDSSGTLTLADAIVALQVVTDSVPEGQALDPEATIVPADGIGVAEAIYTLKTIAE